MCSKNLRFSVIIMGMFTLGLAGARAAGVPSNAKNVASPLVTVVDWACLTLEAHFPKPFGDVKTVVKQSKGKSDPKITGIEVSFHGHTLRFPKSLLKGLVLASDPEIGYRANHGEVTSLSIFFRYGYPVQVNVGIPGCISSKCAAYHVAEFLVDKNYRVTRHNSLIPLKVGYRGRG